MAEYIKREDVLKIVDEFYDHPIGKGIAKSIFCLPAADVVEVVWCKDCVYWQKPPRPSSKQTMKRRK